MIGVHGYIGVKSTVIQRHFCKTGYQNFGPFLANWAFKFLKKVLIWPTNFFSTAYTVLVPISFLYFRQKFASLRALMQMLRFFSCWRHKRVNKTSNLVWIQNFMSWFLEIILSQLFELDWLSSVTSAFSRPRASTVQSLPGAPRARFLKSLWSPGIDSKKWIPPAYVAWRAGTITLFLLGS